jgi:uncharacterized damage-inducible protein DinB
MHRPQDHEFPSYALPYIEAAAAALAAQGHNDLLALLEAQPREWTALLAPVDAARAGYAYAPGKWTLAESLVHVNDTERVFAYRLLRIARGDRTPLPGFEQDDWVPTSRAHRRTFPDLLAELRAVRESTVTLVRSLDDAALTEIGTASGRAISARALVWMIAGHAAHHLTLTRTHYLA